MLTYLTLRALSVLVPFFPPRLGRRLAIVLGDLGFWLLGGPRRSVEANLRRVLGDDVPRAELRATARSVFRTGALNYYDLFRIPRLDLAGLERVVTVRGWEHLEAALRGGRGAIVVSAHLGNLDVAGQVAVARSVPCTVPAEQLRSRRVLDLVTRLRSSRGLRIVPLDGSAAPVRALVQALHRNELVGIVGDRDVQATGLPVRFFGEVTRMPGGPATLALHSGAPLLPVRVMRRKSGNYYVEILPPIDLPRTGNLKRDVQSGTELIAATLERFISETPGQWVVFKPFWANGRSENGRRETDPEQAVELANGPGRRLRRG